MLWTIVVILVVLWAVGKLAIGVTSGFLYLLLVVAVVIGLVQLFTGRRT